MHKKPEIRHYIETQTGQRHIRQYVDLDEVVIPGILHIEDMGDGVWCIIFGDHDLHVSASKRGVTIVDRSDKVRE